MFSKTKHTTYLCPSCGSGMVIIETPINSVVCKCKDNDCGNEYSPLYLDGWYSGMNEALNIKSESFGAFRSRIAALEAALAEAREVVKPFAEAYTFDEKSATVDAFSRAAEWLKKQEASA